MINKNILNRFKISETARQHVTSFSASKKLVCEENNKKFILNTEKGSFYKIKLDGGIKKKGSEGKKVDFIVVDIDNSIEAYIELKGSDVRGALKQISDTFKDYKQHNSNNKCYAYVVSSGSRIPKNSSSITNEIDKLAKMLRRKPIIATNQIKVSYSLEGHEFILM